MRYIVITGGSRGIGAAIAEAFLKQGATVGLVAQNAQRLHETVQALQRQYGKDSVLSWAGDLSNADACKSICDQITKQLPVVDILVNNAGTFLPGELMHEPEGLLESMMATNVYSAYHMTRGLLSHLEKSSTAHIFNLCSVAALQAYDNGGAYSITKYALRGFNTNLRKELMPKKIKVTGIFPGATWTDSWTESGVSESRLMSANDIAQLIVQCAHLSPTAVVEELIVRPLLGDL